MTQSEAKRYRKHINGLLTSLDDASALPVTDLFESWKENTLYFIGNRVKYNNFLYRCIQGHTSQDNWTPDATPALWTRVSVDEWPEWVQPTGAQDAYMTGDKVSHIEKHWVSLVDNNVWEPGTSYLLWEEVE